jgi:hypothetical protein
VWETINFYGRKAKFSVTATEKSFRSGVINKSPLRKLRGLVKCNAFPLGNSADIIVNNEDAE